MQLADLIARLSDPAAYPHPVEGVEVHQTHISVVFLAGSYAYKVKKPLDLGFLDYGSLEKRRHYCERELILNRRLAPSVYLEVVPVTEVAGSVEIDGDGETVEWALKMERLPEAATLDSRIRAGRVGEGQVEALALRIAEFHAAAESGPRIAEAGRFEAVARNARENFEGASSHVGTTLSRPVFERLSRLTEDRLAEHRELIEGRAERGLIRDTHGDLRLEHVYLFPERTPPDDLIVVDCIEFSDRFRHADPVADMAFLVMDFARLGRTDLARAFTDAYFRASGDGEGRTLLPFYVAYRAAVRGKVQGMKHGEAEISPSDRQDALAEARAHWLQALANLESPGRRPCLILIGGLPGTGKSTLARGLAEKGGVAVIRSDRVRKELAGLEGHDPAAAPFGEGLYSPEWTERTYEECARRAEGHLFDGERVAVDASFGSEANRRRFLDLAERWGVPALFFHCQADAEVVRTRLDNRRNDASDADWSVHEQAARRWEPPGPITSRATRAIPAGDREVALSKALEVLKGLELLD